MLKPGKLPNHILADLLIETNSRHNDPRLLIGPGIGEDAAHIDFGPSTLIAKTDPITFATRDIGWYAVNVNANDIAVAGGTPKWFLATLLMPAGSTESQIRDIFNQLQAAAEDISVTLAGGHTEITHAVSQPVICGFMLGEATAGRTFSASGAKPGDSIILTKGIAIEGTAILAREARDQLLAEGVSPQTADNAARLLTNPGISVLPDARALANVCGLHAMHDITEGGIATAAAELACAANLDIQLRYDRVTVLPETAEICAALQLNPWGLISSGALLAAVDPDQAENALRVLADAGVNATIIGTTCAPSSPHGPTVAVVDDRGNISPVEIFERDEMARYFDTAVT